LLSGGRPNALVLISRFETFAARQQIGKDGL